MTPKTLSAFGLAALALSACSTGGPPSRMELTSTLTGHQSVPGPGDLAGTGTFRANVNSEDGQICWELNARGIAAATAAAIYRGTAGTAGAAVVPLPTPGANGRSQGCAPIATAIAVEMIGRPDMFYVNITNPPYPQSAIRGQLRGDVRRSRSRPRSS